MKSFLIAVMTLIAGLHPCGASAQSEKIVTTKPTYLYVTPQVQPQALAAVETGAEFKVVRLEGDWYLVEYQHSRWGQRRGYIQRSVARITASASSRLPNSNAVPAIQSPAPQPSQAGAESAPKPPPPTPEHVAPPQPAPRPVPRNRPSVPRPHASLLPGVPYATSTCESGHWIDAVEGDGKIIKLGRVDLAC